MERLVVEIREEDEGSRLDKVVASAIGPDLSRTQIQQWIKDGHVLVSDNIVKPNYRLKLGDQIDDVKILSQRNFLWVQKI